MDSDEDFKHYSSCYYDDDTDRAFYPENAQHRHQLDTKNWFDGDKTAIVAHQQPQCTPQQLILDNIVTSSDKIRNCKSGDRWTSSIELPKDLTCDVEASSLRSVSTNTFFIKTSYLFYFLLIW